VATFVDGIYKSVDGGRNWIRFDDGLTDLNIRALAIVPGATTTLYAATPSGVFRTVDVLPPVTEALWQEAVTAMKAAAGSDSLNFWQWAWYWQYLPAFPGAPVGFGTVGSISPAVMEQIITAGGGNGFRVVSAEQWMLYFRQVTQPPDPWNLAIATIKTAAGSDSQNFWQWAWYWQYLPAFQGAPLGFGTVGSISPGLMEQIIMAGGGDGFRTVSAAQWVLYYRQSAQPPSAWQPAITAIKAAAGTNSQNFWQWAWYWQYLPAFQGAPLGFGVVGSISPALMEQIIMTGGGDGFHSVSAEQWLQYYRQAMCSGCWDY
jgi:hypothetical protein